MLKRVSYRKKLISALLTSAAVAACLAIGADRAAVGPHLGRIEGAVQGVVGRLRAVPVGAVAQGQRRCQSPTCTGSTDDPGNQALGERRAGVHAP